MVWSVWSCRLVAPHRSQKGDAFLSRLDSRVHRAVLRAGCALDGFEGRRMRQSAQRASPGSASSPHSKHGLVSTPVLQPVWPVEAPTIKGWCGFAWVARVDARQLPQ